MNATDSKQPKTPKTPKTPKVEKTEKERPVLLNFTEHAPSEILNSEGLINVDNPEAHGFDDEKFERLSREDFATEPLWLTFKARSYRARAAKLIEAADRMERDAANGNRFGDPAKRAQVKKLQKVAAAYAELRKALAAEGIDVDSLVDGTKPQA